MFNAGQNTSLGVIFEKYFLAGSRVIRTGLRRVEKAGGAELFVSLQQ